MAIAAVIFTAFVPSAFAVHEDFSSMGSSCCMCHDPHGATGGSGQSLFVEADLSLDSTSSATIGLTTPADFANASTEDLCEYCHVYQGHNAFQVYGEGLHDGDNERTMAEHGIGFTGPIPCGSASGEVLNGDGKGGLGCIDCHNALPHMGQSHTAVTMATPTSASQNLYARDADVTAFCARCHTDNNATVLGGVSHILTGSRSAPFTMNTTNFGTQQVAWLGTPTCLSCHGAVEFHNLVSATGVPGSQTATGVAFTNFAGGSDGADAYSTSVVGDGLCAMCHTDSGSFVAYVHGVGKTY